MKGLSGDCKRGIKDSIALYCSSIAYVDNGDVRQSIVLFRLVLRLDMIVVSIASMS